MQPSNQAEYLKRFHENNKVTGFGIGNVYCHVPCPFCAAPEFMCWEILAVEDAMKRGATCKECGRSAKAIFKNINGGKSFEIVQTGGVEQPEWLEPKMRRIEVSHGG